MNALRIIILIVSGILLFPFFLILGLLTGVCRVYDAFIRGFVESFDDYDKTNNTKR